MIGHTPGRLTDSPVKHHGPLNRQTYDMRHILYQGKMDLYPETDGGPYTLPTFSPISLSKGTID